jgi:hypothetical protein
MRSRQALNTAPPTGDPSAIDPPFTTGSHSLIAWFIPDMALVFAITTLLMLFLKFGGATGLFGDSDTGWHIRIGEQIIATGALPHADPFSFSKPGAPWIAWEWGADVLMGATNRISGLGGVALLYGLSIGAVVWMWFRLNRRAGGNLLIAALLFFIMLPVTVIHWHARPHIFSWLFLLGTVWLCERMPHRVRSWQIALVAIAAAAWANIHASFFFAPLILLIYAAGAYLKPLIWEPLSFEPPAGDAGGAVIQETWSHRGLSYFLLAVVALVGTLANPNGWRLHQHVISYLSDSWLISHIDEFRSFDFQSTGALKVMIMLAICVAGGFAALASRKPERFLLSMFLTAVALRSVRALPVAALLVLPLANGSITAVLARASNLAPRLRRRLDDALGYGDRLDAIDRQLSGFAIVPLIAVLIFAFIRTSSGFPSEKLPVAASAVVASLPASARVFALDYFGGYLIYRFNGERKVFVDGRSDFYGKEIMERYLSLIHVTPGWTHEFNRWSFTHALLPPDSPLVAALEASGWREIYRDRTAVLLTGKSTI